MNCYWSKTQNTNLGFASDSVCPTIRDSRCHTFEDPFSENKELKTYLTFVG